MTTTLRNLAYAGIGAASLGWASLAAAKTTSEEYLDEFGDYTELGDDGPDEIAIEIINIALGFVALIAVAVMIYGGYLVILSAGNEEQIEKGKKLVLAAIIGMGLIFISWGLTTWVINNLINATSTQ